MVGSGRHTHFQWNTINITGNKEENFIWSGWYIQNQCVLYCLHYYVFLNAWEDPININQRSKNCCCTRPCKSKLKPKWTDHPTMKPSYHEAPHSFQSSLIVFSIISSPFFKHHWSPIVNTKTPKVALVCTSANLIDSRVTKNLAWQWLKKWITAIL